MLARQVLLSLDEVLNQGEDTDGIFKKPTFQILNFFLKLARSSLQGHVFNATNCFLFFFLVTGQAAPVVTTEGEMFEYCFTLTVPDIPENPITLVVLEVVNNTPGMYRLRGVSVHFFNQLSATGTR